MKTNITLDAGMTAFMATITDKLNKQAKACKWLGLGLVAFGICNAILIKRIEKLENEVSDIDTAVDMIGKFVVSDDGTVVDVVGEELVQ